MITVIADVGIGTLYVFYISIVAALYKAVDWQTKQLEVYMGGSGTVPESLGGAN